MKILKWGDYLNMYNKISVEQIYNFTCEIPDFSKKTNLEKIKLFFINIQDYIPNKKNLKNCENEFVIIINKTEVTLNLIEAPIFTNRGLFISWVLNKISSK